MDSTSSLQELLTTMNFSQELLITMNSSQELLTTMNSSQELLITMDSSQEIMIMLLPQVLTHTEHTDTYVLALIAARLHHHLLQMLALQFTDRVLLPIEAWFRRAARLLPLHSALDPKSKQKISLVDQSKYLFGDACRILGCLQMFHL
jgi:hypothetical protein